MRKKIAYFLIGFSTLFLILFAFLQTSFFAHFVIDKTTTFIEQKTGIKAQIKQIEYIFPHRVTIQEISGGGIHIDKLDLDIALDNLLQGNLSFNQILINAIAIEKEIQIPQQEGNSSQPFACIIDHLQINKIIFKEHVVDLNGLLDFNGVNLTGNLDLQYNKLPNRPMHLFFSCKQRGQDIVAEIALQNQKNRLKGDVTFKPDTSLIIENFKAETTRFTAEGVIHLSPDYNLDGTNLKIISDISHLTPQLKGGVLAHCHLSGHATAPVVEIKSYSPLIYNPLLKAVVTECYGNFNCQWDSEILCAHAELNGIFAKDAFQASGDITWLPKQKLKISNFKGEHRSASMMTDLDIDLVANQMAGEIEGSIDDLTRLEIEAEGPLSFHAQFYLDKDKKQEAEISLHTPHLKGRDFALERASVKALLTNIFDSPTGTLKGYAQKMTFADWSLTDINYESHNNPNSPMWEYHFSCQGIGDKRGNLAAKGSWGIINQIMNIHFDSCSGSFMDFPFQLLEPASIQFSSEQFDLTPFYFAIAGGTAYTSFEYMPNYLHMISRINNIPLETLHITLPAFPATGMLDANVFLYGDPTKLKGQVQVDLAKVRVHEESFNQLSDFNAQLVLNVLDSSIECNGMILVEQYHPIEMQSDFPLTVSLAPAKIHIDGEKDFNMHFMAEGEISPLMQLLVTDTTNISGQTRINVKVFGKIDDPQIQGDAEFINGTFESPETGALYKNICAKLEGIGNQLYLKQLHANDTDQGTISGSGTITIDPSNHFPLDLNLEIKDTRLVHLDYINATGNGLLSLKGNLKEASLEGKIVADAVKATIPEKSQALIHSVEVAYINQSRTEKEPTQALYKPTVWPIKLNLQLEAAKLITITSPDLDSTWKGGLNVKGTTTHPLLYGEIKLKQGEYHYHGKDFDIREGKITFAGEPDKNTTLYVIASQEFENIRADVILKGPISTPSISFRSNPPMSQREILSWILFGHGTSDLTPFQGSQLSESITNLKTSSGKGPDLFTKFKDKIGIDKIDINHNSEGDDNQVSVRVGKYISKGVLVSIDKSISAEANRLAIEAAVIKDIKVQAEVGDDAEGHLRLKWKKDY